MNKLLALAFLGLILCSIVLADGGSSDSSSGMSGGDGPKPYEGGGDHEDGGKDGEERVEELERETQVEVRDKSVEIQSEQKAGKSKDKFKLEFIGDGDVVELRMQQFSKAADTVSGFQFRVRFWGVVEYVESQSGPAGLDPSDQRCTVYPISGRNFIVTRGADQQVGNATISTFLGSSTAGNGVGADFFQVKLYVSTGLNAGAFQLDSKVIYPTSVKFDIIINAADAGFNYTCAGSRLALVAKAKSSQKTAQRQDAPTDAAGTPPPPPPKGENARAVQFGSAATPAGFFSWATTVSTVDANGVSGTANIIFGGLQPEQPAPAPAPASHMTVQDDGHDEREKPADVRPGEGIQRAIYSFDIVQPKKISWDPEIGYTSNTSGVAQIAASIATVLAIIVAILAL